MTVVARVANRKVLCGNPDKNGNKTCRGHFGSLERNEPVMVINALFTKIDRSTGREAHALGPEAGVWRPKNIVLKRKAHAKDSSKKPHAPTLQNRTLPLARRSTYRPRYRAPGRGRPQRGPTPRADHLLRVWD